MDYSYVRISSTDQNENRQLDAMKAYGIKSENIFLDKLSGKNTKRPKLQELMSLVKSGDTIVVESFSRFARNTKDLLDLVEQLKDKGVEFVSLKESFDTTTPTGKLILTMLGAIYEFEREMILQRQTEGIASARKRGKHLGRPAKKRPKNFGKLVKAWENKEIPLQKVLTECGGVCPATFYNWLKIYRTERDFKR